MTVEYRWSKSTTANYTNVARVFSGLDDACRWNMHWVALTMLARETVDPIARARALQLARAGIIVDKRLAEALIAQAH
ncbi:MAG TPA: hypothetical protein VGH74_02305, partial [Planctomycetaceae bacterium]